MIAQTDGRDGSIRWLASQRSEDLAMSIQRDREMAFVWIKRGATVRNGAGQISAQADITIALSVPEKHGHVNGSEVYPPRTCEQADVPDGSSSPCAKRLAKKSREVVSVFRVSKQASIGFWK